MKRAVLIHAAALCEDKVVALALTGRIIDGVPELQQPYYIRLAANYASVSEALRRIAEGKPE